MDNVIDTLKDIAASCKTKADVWMQIQTLIIDIEAGRVADQKGNSDEV